MAGPRNFEIPAPGSKGVAVVRTARAGGVELVEVRVYAPDGGPSIIMDGASLGDEVFEDEAAARRAVSGAIANNPVIVVNLDDVT